MQLLTNTEPIAESDPLPAEKVTPFGNYVLVQLDAIPEKSKGGIFKPQSVVKAEQEDVSVNPFARVLAVGLGLPMDDGRRYPIDVKVGDKVQLLRVLAPALSRDDSALGVKADGRRFYVDVGQILGKVEESARS